MRAHNYNEVVALVKEATKNGTIYDLDGTTWTTHETALHIADVYINNKQEVVLRSYNHTKDSINLNIIAKANEL